MKVLILGGNKFFGRHLALTLLHEGHEVTLLNRGLKSDDFGDRVRRLTADRTSEESLAAALKVGDSWDLVYDQLAYSAADARAACRLFRERAGLYIVTSTEAVYDYGAEQTEECFNARDFEFSVEIKRSENYRESKRQMEATFCREAAFPLLIVRPSLVVGVDDYTRRLHWYIERIQTGAAIYCPNPDIRLDFIRSDQAGLALKILGVKKIRGVVNCTTRGSVSHRTLISWCEEALEKRATFADANDGQNHSPYGGEATRTMNTDRLYSIGFTGDPNPEWLKPLIAEMATAQRRGTV